MLGRVFSVLAAGVVVAIFAACSSTTNNVVVVPGDDGGTGDDDGGSSGTPPPSGADGQAPPPPPEVTTTNGSMSFNGTTRTYLVAVPVDYTTTKTYPLVIDFHGDGGTGAQMQKDWPVESATHKDAIIVYPDGIGRTWDLYDTGTQNPDMPWIKALIDDLATKYSIDKTRVLGSGYSKGAFFVNEMACNYPGVFKAIAVFEGGAPDEEFNSAGVKDGQGYWTCPNEQPTAAFVFQGDADGTVTPDSGNFDGMYWAHINGCGSSLSSTDPSPCQQYDGCPSGKRVTYCLVPGLNHVVWYPQGRAAAWSYFTSLP